VSGASLHKLSSGRSPMNANDTDRNLKRAPLDPWRRRRRRRRPEVNGLRAFPRPEYFNFCASGGEAGARTASAGAALELAAASKQNGNISCSTCSICFASSAEAQSVHSALELAQNSRKSPCCARVCSAPAARRAPKLKPGGLIKGPRRPKLAPLGLHYRARSAGHHRRRTTDGRRGPARQVQLIMGRLWGRRALSSRLPSPEGFTCCRLAPATVKFMAGPANEAAAGREASLRGRAPVVNEANSLGPVYCHLSASEDERSGGSRAICLVGPSDLLSSGRRSPRARDSPVSQAKSITPLHLARQPLQRARPARWAANWLLDAGSRFAARPNPPLGRRSCPRWAIMQIVCKWLARQARARKPSAPAPSGASSWRQIGRLERPGERSVSAL